MKNAYLITWVLAASLLAGCGEKTETTTLVTQTSTSTTATITTTSATPTSSQTYPISQQYSAPENSTETLKWSLVVDNWTIKSVNIENNWTTREAKENIWNFSDAIAWEVVGKSLKGLQIGKVWWASLSSAAFNEALKGINS